MKKPNYHILAHFWYTLYMKSLSLSQPHLLIPVGIPGSGKTSFAEKFAATFQSPYIHYDTIMTATGHNGASSDALAGYMLKELFKTGHTLVFDGPTASRLERSALKELAASAGYKTLFVWVQTDTTTAKTRYIKSHHKLGRRVSGAQYDAAVRAFEAPSEKEQPIVVVSGKHTYATQAKAVLKNLLATKQAARKEIAHDHANLVPVKRSISIR